MEQENKTPNSVYFAAKPAEECASVLSGKIDDWTSRFKYNGYLNKVRRSWEFYHGIFYEEGFDAAHMINRTGEQEELYRLNINHYRNIAQNMLVMTTTSRPKVECRAVNTDYKSQVQTQLATSLLDYYFREKGLDNLIREVTEYAIVLGSGFIKIDWDETRGEQIAFNEETQTPIYDGDLSFTKLSPYDVIFDPSRDGWDHDWLVVRSQKNKYDLAAKYPDLSENILRLSSISEQQGLSMDGRELSSTDLVNVFEFIHKRTPAMPNGRYMVFCSYNTIMVDSPMPYRVMNVYRIAPSNIIGTPFGYTTMFDLLPTTEALNSLYSAAFTNNSTFGIQNILVPEDGGYNVTELSGGLNLIKGDFEKGKPESLNLTNTSPELYNFMGNIEKLQETISGVNATIRGNPEASLRSGSALAVVQAQAIQFMSGLQQQYAKLIEETSTGMIRILQDFAKTPRLATIVGISQRSKLREFSGADIEAVNRVVCTMSNPLQDTLAGRLGIADQLLQYQQIDGKQYINILAHGTTQEITEPVADTFELIKLENEMMMAGEIPVVMLTDEHDLHIKKHREVLNNPYIREEPEATQAVIDHIQEHINILKTADPMILAMFQQQSLAPQQPMPGGPGDQGAAEEVTAAPVEQGSGMEMNAEEQQIEGGSLESPINISQPPRV